LKVGNGRKTRFCEDQWFISCSLAIQYWELNLLHYLAIEEAWDGLDLKFTFHMIVDTRLWNQWQEVVQISTGLDFEDEEDAMIWQFTSSGRYLVQSPVCSDQ
jgi:hypothetical protein